VNFAIIFEMKNPKIKKIERNGDHKKIEFIGIMKLPEENMKHSQFVNEKSMMFVGKPGGGKVPLGLCL
jgi:hypothetical protein